MNNESKVFFNMNNFYQPFTNSACCPFRLAFSTSEWKKLDENTPRRAGVSSFGFGGVNAHVLLEEFLLPRGEVGDFGNEVRDTVIDGRLTDSFQTRQSHGVLIGRVNSLAREVVAREGGGGQPQSVPVPLCGAAPDLQ